MKVDGGRGDLFLGGVVSVSEMSTVGKTETHDSVLRVDESGEGGEAAE